VIPGVTNRELWMLVAITFTAAFFACLNYGLTKVGLDKRVPWYKWKKPIMIGGALGLLIWASTKSGAVSHETGIFMSANAGWLGEKAIALYLNKKESAIIDPTAAGVPKRIALRKKLKAVGPVVPENWIDLRPPSKKS